MLTQCPNCQTMFRVTSEILRVADGQVRCGRCQRQFDAMERLIEENDDESMQERASSESTIEVEEPSTHEDITMEGRHIEISGTYRVPDQFGNEARLKEETIEEWVEIEGIDDPVEHPDDSGIEFNTEPPAEDAPFKLFDDTASELAAQARRTHATDEPFPDEDVGSEHAANDRPAADAVDHEGEAVRAEPIAITPVVAPIRASRPSRFALNADADRAREDASESTEDDLLALQPRRQRSSKIWYVLAAPLIILLIGQWAHSYRATLARHPTIGPHLLAAYQSLGMSLTPGWDLHAYQIRQWGIVSDPSQPGTLRVRASVTNLADFAQPYPLLKLVLEDRWGDQLRAREFEPTEYLDPTIAANRMLSPGQQTNATIAIVDPGPDAEGFRFDVCLRGSAGTVCGGEVRRP